MNLYFSQNDPRWKDAPIGSSPYLMGGKEGKGCTTSCISDASSYFGEEVDPSVLVKKLRYTDKNHPLGAGLILWSSLGEFFKTFKFEWRFYGYDKNRIEQGLKDPNRCVLLNVNRGAHWVFLLSRNIPFVGHRTSDPYPFPAKARYYTPAQITGGAVLIRKK